MRQARAEWRAQGTPRTERRQPSERERAQGEWWGQDGRGRERQAAGDDASLACRAITREIWAERRREMERGGTDRQAE
jgi:hypothetical protein